MPALLEYVEVIADFVFPRICCGCECRIQERRRILCSDCENGLEQLKQPICQTCGCPDAILKGAGRCSDCPSGTIEFQKARGTTPFGSTGKLIVEKLKYQARLEYAPVMARRLLNTMLSEFSEVAFSAVVPVPLHAARRRERGFNQSEETAKYLSRYAGVPLVAGALVRSTPTVSQTRLTRRERAKNIAGAFAAGKVNVAGQTILLIDDVYTTGATLNECARVIREGGAERVYCLAFARAMLHPHT